MRAQAELPTQEYVWGVLMPRITAALEAEQGALWQLSGLSKEYGPPNENFTGEREAKEMIAELTGLLMCAIALDTQARQNEDNKRVGRPRDSITPYLAPNLLSFFLRIHNRSGRHSVATGDRSQTEAGPLFEFLRAVIQPINEYLLEKRRRPLSPARMARFALKERRCESRLIALKLEKSLAPALKPEEQFSP